MSTLRPPPRARGVGSNASSRSGGGGAMFLGGHPCAHQHRGGIGSPPPCTLAPGGGTGTPPLGTSTRGGGTGTPSPDTAALGGGIGVYDRGSAFPSPVHHSTRLSERVPLPYAPQHRAGLVPHPFSPQHMAEGQCSPTLQTTAQGGGTHQSIGRRDRFPTPLHISTGFPSPMHHNIGRDWFPNPTHHSTGWRDWFPTCVHHSTRRRDHIPHPCAPQHMAER